MAKLKTTAKSSATSTAGTPSVVDSSSALPLPNTGSAAPSAPARAPNEILVQFDDTPGAAGRAKALAAVSGKAMEVLWSDGHGDGGAQLLRVKLTGNVGIDKAIEMLSNQPGVKFAEANFALSTQATSNDPQYTNGALWGMRGDASGSLYGSAADEAWAAGLTGSSKIVVGVIDTGVDYRHQDLYKNIWLNQGEISSTLRSALVDTDSDGLITFRDLNNGANQAQVTDLNANGYIDAGDLLSDSRWENGIDNDGNGYVDDLIGWDFVNNDNDPFDDNRHGTHVSGTIGGEGGNAVGVAGVNWSTQIMGLKFLAASGSGYTSDALKALDYYTNMSKAAPSASDFVGTNNSWGGGGFSQSMQDAIGRTGAAGNLFVAAAGNGGSDGVGDNNDTLANYPSNYSTQATLGWDAVVAVASLTSSGALSSFSNYGNLTVDLAAPGSSIMSTLPNGAYGYLSGTSMATPHVMGALALISSALPNATPQQCLDLLKQCVTYKADLAGNLAWDGVLDLGKLAGLLASSGPKVTDFALTDTALKTGDTATVTLTFSEAVAGLTASDIKLSAVVGTVDSLASTDGIHWTATLTPSSNVEAQGVKLSLASGSYTSADGARAGQAYTSSAFAVDTKAPTVGITLADSQLTTGETTKLTFVFSEIVSGFDTSDITASNGTVSGLASTDGRTWTATFTPAANTQASVNNIAVGADYTDAAGNAGTAGASANFTIDTTLLPVNYLYGTNGSDTLVGTANADVISGVPAATTQYGRGSLDTLTGNGGTDVFVLGVTGRVFYDDGVAKNLGTSDYARITDFTAGIDDLQLAAGKTYAFAATSVAGSSGLGIYVDVNGNGRVDAKMDEMIGVLVGVNTINPSDIVLV